MSKILTNEKGEPYCDTCGCLMGWRIDEHRIICSSCYIGGPTCYDCMIEHCLHTSCLECKKGNYPDCEHLERKIAYLEDD